MVGWWFAIGAVPSAAVALFLLTWLPRSLWSGDPAADDPGSRAGCDAAAESARVANRFMLRAAGAVAASVLVCGAVALAGALLGWHYAPVEVVLVCAVPVLALLIAELAPTGSGTARGSMLRPRRLRDVVPVTLLAAVPIATLFAVAGCGALYYLGAVPFGSARSVHWGLGCAVPPGGTWTAGFRSSPVVDGGAWSLGLFLACLPAPVLAAGTVAHCHLRPSLVADAAADAGLRRCVATRALAAAGVVAALLATVSGSRIAEVAGFVRFNDDWVRQLAGGTTPPPGITDCLLSQDVLDVWSIAGGVGDGVRLGAMVLLIWAVACYCHPGRAPGMTAPNPVGVA